ncbi:MAG: endo-1,4-beta-xylanase [Clostridia bacterium]|nr:endo-1,4-beta-xylanase [Clostridia bacterium]
MRRRTILILAALAAALCFLVTSLAEAPRSAYEQYLEDGSFPSLKERYQDTFLIGVAVPENLLSNRQARELIAGQFNSMTCENEMKPDFTLSWADTRQQKDPDRAVVFPSRAKAVLNFARDNGLRVRAHTLVWHSQTPRWFFAQNWDKSPSAPLVDRETMIRRMENYIHDMMDWVNGNYPGIVYAWDVVNEAIEPGNGHPEGLRTQNNLWYDTIGDDWVELAFTFARKYAAPDQKLFYNDYGCTDTIKFGRIRPLLKKLKEKDLIDGLGMQCHIGIDSPSASNFEQVITNYAHIGLTIHLTELDVNTDDGSVMGQMKLAVRYRTLFTLFQRLKERAGIDIESITFWGLTDDRSWLNSDGPRYPLLFDRKLQPKAAFFGVLQDASIPWKSGEDVLQETIDRLHLDAGASQEDEDVTVYKTLAQHNPVMVQRFGADPWAMVYGDRVYLYMTGDQPVINADGTVKTNDYGNINTIRVVSSDDLVNWQDHGEIRAAGRNGAARWAGNSWAPCAAWKTIDGQDRFFLYFANSGGGIGVLTADSPTGPFTDPLGRALVSRSTPICASVTWLFDPAVLVDDDGAAYLYFGGGIPSPDKASAPGTARAVKLGEDMISLDGTPVALDPPWLFEDSGINRIGDTYVYSYCSNFNVPAAGSEQGFGSGEIVYMTSDQPLGPFTFAGRVLRNPGSYFGVGGNNHHCMFEFKGQWYITYHAATVDRDKGWNAGYRSTFVDALQMGEDGLPALSKGTLTGVPQVKPLDPYRETEAETLAALAGAEVPETADASSGLAVQSRAAGSWIAVAGADFGAEGARRVSLTWKSEKDAAVSLALGDPEAEAFAAFQLPASEAFTTQTFDLPQPLQGTQNLILRFGSAGITLDRWQFLP